MFPIVNMIIILSALPNEAVPQHEFIIRDGSPEEQKSSLTAEPDSDLVENLQLDLSSQGLTDFPPVQATDSIKMLDISYNNLSHFNFLPALKNLTVFKAAQSNDKVKRNPFDMGFLFHLPYLKEANLSGLPIILESGEHQESEIESLNLSFCEFRTTDFFRFLTSCKHLGLSYSNLRTLNWISQKLPIRGLAVDHTQVKDIRNPSPV